MRKKVGKRRIAAACVATIIGGFAWWHFYGFSPWAQVSSTVYVDGKLTPMTTFRSAKGLISFRDLSDVRYVCDLNRDKVGIPNSSSFSEAFGRLWPKPGDAYFGVSMGGAKIEMKPNVVHEGNSFAFTKKDGHRVEIRL